MEEQKKNVERFNKLSKEEQLQTLLQINKIGFLLHQLDFYTFAGDGEIQQIRELFDQWAIDFQSDLARMWE